MMDSAPSAAAPTLVLGGARIERGGSALLSALDLQSDAQRIGLIGAWQPLFQALTGQAQVLGKAQILGCNVRQALARGVVGLALCDAALPASFTVLEYLRAAARLSHGSAARAVRDCERTIEEYALSRVVTHRLSQLPIHERRALSIACAAVASPPVVCLEEPLRGLDAQAGDYVARLCAVTARRSRVIVSVAPPSTPSPERSLLDDCQELFVLERGALVGQGSPNQIFAPSARYRMRVDGAGVAAFTAQLQAAGCRVSAREGQYMVDLPQQGNTDLLLDAALSAALTVLELEPLFRSG